MVTHCKMHQRAVVTAVGAEDNVMTPKLTEGEVVVCIEDNEGVPFVMRESLFLEKGEYWRGLLGDYCPMICNDNNPENQDVVLVD